MIWTIVVVLLILAVLGAPGVGLHNYGYWPSGGLGLILVVLIILAVLGRV